MTIDIEAARGLCEAADTFDVAERAVDMPEMVGTAPYWYVRATDGSRPVLARDEESALFYVAARAGWPAALDEVERLRAPEAHWDCHRQVEAVEVERDSARAEATQWRAQVEKMRSVVEASEAWVDARRNEIGMDEAFRARSESNALCDAVDAYRTVKP